MDDTTIVQRIGMLADKERDLERAHLGNGSSEDDTLALREIGIELDQCWDLLRQRRARRYAGQDPNAAASRGASVVERYLQ